VSSPFVRARKTVSGKQLRNSSAAPLTRQIGAAIRGGGFGDARAVECATASARGGRPARVPRRAPAHHADALQSATQPAAADSPPTNSNQPPERGLAENEETALRDSKKRTNLMILTIHSRFVSPREKRK